MDNTTEGDALVELTYEVRGPNGEQVMYWNGIVTTGVGSFWWGLPGMVPDGMGGAYTFTGYGLYEGLFSQTATTTCFVTGASSTNLELAPSAVQTPVAIPAPQ